MTRIAIVLTLLLATQVPAGTSTIAGVVTDDRGTPVAGARLTLTCTAPPLTRSAVADATGRFTFATLPAGTFNLAGAAAGYAPREFGQERQDAVGTPIQLSSAQRVEAPVKLPRLASISGVLRDERGQPGTGRVSALGYVRTNGVRTRRSIAFAEAEADGSYRLADLPPADYVVSATGAFISGDARRMTPELIALATQAVLRPDEPVSPGDTLAPTFRYAPVYYPAASTEAAATPIVLGPAEERRGIDLELRIAETTRIDGVVLDPFGKPIQSALVDVIDPKGQRSSARSSPSSAEGQFRVSGLAPGSYVLMTHHTIRTSGPGEPDVLVPLWGFADVDAVSGVTATATLRLEPAMTVMGHLVFEGASPPPRDLTKVRVELVTVGGPFRAIATTGSMLSRIDARGRFTISGVPPGTFAVRAMLDGASPWTLQSATVNGREVVDAPFEIAQGTDVGDVAVTLTDRGTEISGVVTDAGDRPLWGTIAVFSAESRWWTPGSRRVQLARVETNGRFVIRGMPPGEYLAAFGDAATLSVNSLPDPAMLARLQTGAERFTLAEAEKKAIAIRVR